MNTTTGLIAPVIEVRYDANTFDLPTLYMQAVKVQSSTNTYFKNHIFDFEFCADKPKSLVRI